MKGQEGPRGFQLVGGADAPALTFSAFVLSLSASGLLHLGVHPDDALGLALDEPVEVNLPACQQTIDILELLREKTRGNLSQDETKLLETVLHDLHMRFVAAMPAAQAKPSSTPALKPTAPKPK